MEIFIIIAVIILIVALVVYKIANKGLRKTIIDFIALAEESFKHGQNNLKMNFVIDNVIKYITDKIPFLRMVITRKNIEKMIQKIFDEIKTALNVVPSKEK